MVHEIYIIDNNNELIENLKESFKRELDEFHFKTVQTAEIEVALKNIPSLIIIDEDTTDVNIYVLEGENKLKGIAELAAGEITEESLRLAEVLIKG